tara:strand:- start:535 stop:648 length:114 start_codon:yes stop_codon:yes gene_type:complete
MVFCVAVQHGGVAIRIRGEGLFDTSSYEQERAEALSC